MILPLTEAERAALERDGKARVWVRMEKQPPACWAKPPIWVDEDGYWHSGSGSHLGTRSDLRCPLGPVCTRHVYQTAAPVDMGNGVTLTIGPLAPVTTTALHAPEQRDGVWFWVAEVERC